MSSCSIMEEPFYISKIFSSYNEVNEAKTIYEKHNHINISKRNSVTIKSDYCTGNRKVKVKKDLQYTRITFKCIKSGYYVDSQRERNSKKEKDSVHNNEKIKRKRKTRTFSTKCPFNLTLNVTKDGQKLEVVNFYDEHNHVRDENIFKMLPKQRRLNDPLALEQTKMRLKCGTNKKIIQESDLKKNNAFDTIISLLNNYTDLKYKMLASNYQCEGVFLQTSDMKQNFQAYPEIIFIDSTYRLNMGNMPLYVMFCLDGNGEPEVVSLAFVLDENKDTLSWIAESFINENPKFSEVKCIISDNGMKDKSLFKDYFPGAHLSLCSFHVLKKLKSEITSQIRDTDKDEEIYAREIITKMFHAKDQEAFDCLVKTFKSNVSDEIIEYFEKCWEPIQCEWVRSLQKKFFNLYQSMNNRVERFNIRLKSLVKSCSSMTDFILRLMMIINHHQIERNRRAVDLKQPTEVVKNNAVTKYKQFLTPYACERLEEQLQLIDKVEILNVVEMEEYSVIVKCYSFENLTVSISECSCRFKAGMGLPCRHILHVRREFEKPLFDEGLCNKRWHLSYYTVNQCLLRNIGLTDLHSRSQDVKEETQDLELYDSEDVRNEDEDGLTELYSISQDVEETEALELDDLEDDSNEDHEDDIDLDMDIEDNEVYIT